MSSSSWLTQLCLRLNSCHMMLESRQPSFTYIYICWDAVPFLIGLPLIYLNATRIGLWSMSLGDQDHFGPSARKVQEWGKDTEEEQVKMISRMFEEWENREKAARKKPAPSSAKPPRSLAHHSPHHPHKSKDSYQRPPGQSSHKAHPSSSSAKGQPYTKDRKHASQQSRSRGWNQSAGQNSTSRDKDKEPQQGCSFYKKGRGRGGNNQRKYDRIASCGGKLSPYQPRWTELFSQYPEIIKKISQGILIAFCDEAPSLLYWPLELRSNDRPSDLLQAVKKLLTSHAIEEVTDTSSPWFYSRLFLVPKPDGTFRPIIDLKKLNLFLDIPSFKMEMLFSIIAALHPQEWITKIDRKDAYHHILVHVKYFRFVIAGKTYRLRVLPFGLPRKFNKTLAKVCSYT